MTLDGQTAWATVATVLVFVGLAGSVIPVLPGPFLIWLGAFIWAWADGFLRLGWGTLTVLGVLAVVVGQGSAVYFQIGDGAIVESRREEPDRYVVICWPQQGEYANTTNFLTDADAAAKIFVGLKSGAIDEVALFTDGIQSLVLDYRTQSAHSPFFAPLFAWLRPRAAGHSPELSDSLARYLNSEKINSRTDDDKTLILATRRL